MWCRCCIDGVSIHFTLGSRKHDERSAYVILVFGNYVENLIFDRLKKLTILECFANIYHFSLQNFGYASGVSSVEKRQGKEEWERRGKTDDDKKKTVFCFDL